MDAGGLLGGSVGQGCSNKAVDVRIVQRLLNDALGTTEQPQLKVDGLVGPKTLEAIRTFQRRHAPPADGMLNQNGATINALFNLHLAALQQSVDVTQLSEFIDPSVVQKAPLSDPALVEMIERYKSVLRQSA